MPKPHEPSESQPLNTEQLVHIAYVLQDERRKLDAQIAEVEAALIARGAGKHSGENPEQVVTVIAAVAGNDGKISYALPAEKEAVARELADTEFANLFDRTVSYTPCEGFVNVAPKLLTPAKSRDLIALCAVQGKPFAGRAASVRYK